MTVLRRILLAIVALAFLADSLAWGLVKLSSDSEGPDTMSKTDVVAWVDNAGKAKVVASAIEEAGIKAVQVKAGKRETQKPAGYRLVLHVSRKDIAAPIAETLKSRGHQQVKIVEGDEGTELQLGGTYNSKAQAKALADRVERQESFKFEVVAGTKTVQIDSNKLIVKGLDKEQAKKVVDILVENKIELFEKVDSKTE
ncbi:MAG: hypothetical protein AB7S38_37460 [Vulcanimicrobiota bacterium]